MVRKSRDAVDVTTLPQSPGEGAGSEAQRLDRATRLRRQTATQRIHFLDTDLDVAMTFVRLAETAWSMGHFEHFNDILVKARLARETVAKFLLQVDDPAERQRLRRKHQALTDALKKVERRKRQIVGTPNRVRRSSQ